MPSFFGFMIKYSIPILIPVFFLCTLLFLWLVISDEWWAFNWWLSIEDWQLMIWMECQMPKFKCQMNDKIKMIKSGKINWHWDIGILFVIWIFTLDIIRRIEYSTPNSQFPIPNY
jgi:hypothetical protein